MVDARRPLPWAHCDRPLRLALFSTRHPRLTARLAEEARAILRAAGELVLEDLEGSDCQDLPACGADVVVVLGGDGSILRAARTMADTQTPVLGVNLGKLGFLADVAVEDLTSALAAVRDQDCTLIEHMMFACTVCPESGPELQWLGLNEAAILGGPPYRIMDIALHVDGEWATNFRCDGLIISTPVGSTAHALSAGGPIVRKDLDAFVICPVSPHALTMRPVIDAAHRQYELSLKSLDGLASVVIDGQVVHQLGPNDRVRVQRAEPVFRMVRVPGQSYYRTLRQKLGWSGRITGR